MLKRVRIEVEAESPDQAVELLWKYEHGLQTVEAERFGLGYSDRDFVVAFANWGEPVSERSFYNERLGRDVTEEVIEYDASLPGYVARRVVQYRRLDTRIAPILGRDPANTVPGQAPAVTMSGGTSVPDLPDLDRLRASANAGVWAEEFAKVVPEVDPGLMIGWFANIVETARVLDRGGDPTEVKVTTGGIASGLG